MTVTLASMQFLRRWAPGAILMAALIPAVLAAPQPPQSRPAAPATSQAVLDQQRFNDLLALIEGQNPLQARRTGARELLHQGWRETVPRLTAILRGSDRSAKVAVALALADLPDTIAPDYVEPLLIMLADLEPEVRHAAAGALAAHPDDAVLSRLKLSATSNEQPLVVRLAAIEALGMMPQRSAVAGLAAVLTDADALVAAAALAALERATAQDFQDDPEAAQAWWLKARELPLAEWQRLQIERLVRQSHTTEQRARELEQRLASALRDNYLRTPEGERPALLNSYLADASAAVRQLGLTLVQARLAESKTLAPETAARTRELLAAPEPLVRAAAVRTVATLRDTGDAERFEQLLASERHHVVREALVNGLGYVGGVSAVAPLLELLQTPRRSTASEAVTALGRLAERGVLDEPARGAVAAALLECMQTTSRDEHVMRERLLWAMSRVADPRFGGEFVAALDTPEAATVRLTAVRGIAVLVNSRTVKPNGSTSQPTATSPSALSPQALVDALVQVTADPDVGVRHAATEVLAQQATSDAQVEALWRRLSPESEPEENVRVTAWRGAMRVLAGRPVSEIDNWLAQLPGDDATRRRQSLELLQAAEKSRELQPEARGELGQIRARIAKLRAEQDQIEPALATYLMALEDLRASKSAEATPVAIELLCFALRNDRYDAQVAGALNPGNSTLDVGAVWEAARKEVETCLRPEEAERAVTMLRALQSHPPASMPANIQETLQQLLQRAHAIQAQADAAAVNAALARLRAHPDDEQARQAIIELGPRAVPALRDALRTTLSAASPDADAERRLHDLLKAVRPDWPGFAAEAPLEEKLKALEALNS